MANQSRPATRYPVPPLRHHHQPNGLHPPPPPQQPDSIPYSRLDIYMLYALIIGAAIFLPLFLIWNLVLQADLQVVHLTSLSVTDFNLSSSNQLLSGTWAARFEVYNPNKKITLDYRQLRAWLLYDKELLAQNGNLPFSQDSQNTTILDVSFNIVNVFLDGLVVKHIDKDRADGAMGFNLKVQAVVVSKGGWITFKRRQSVKFLCKNVEVGGLGSNSSLGNLTGGPKKCKVVYFSKPDLVW